MRTLARHLPGHFPRGGGIRLGDHALHFQGAAPSGQVDDIWREQERQGALVLERSKKTNRFRRSGQCAEDSNKTPRKVGPLGNPSEEPDSCPGKNK